MLKDRLYVVTGGATGIGLGITRVLSGYGARIAVVQPQPAACDIANAHVYTGDVREPDAFLDRIAAAEGHIDGLVNNAALTGHVALSPFLEASGSHIRDMLDVNLAGPVLCSQWAARRWVAREAPGSIVHIASVGSFAAQPNASLYCATKAALSMLAKAMALELAPHGIRVNAVAPGDIGTLASKDMPAGPYSRRTPLGRKGTPEEIGEAVAFLLSDRASFITGETLTVDGGYLCY